MVNLNQCCGTCIYHQYDKMERDWECGNENADAYLCKTGYSDGQNCTDYEED